MLRWLLLGGEPAWLTPQTRPEHQPAHRVVAPLSDSNVVLVVASTKRIDDCLQITTKPVPFGEHALPLLITVVAH